MALVALAAGAAAGCHEGSSETERYVIHVALQDGFMDEHVVLRLDGDEVFASESVNTRFQIGLANELELEVAGEASQLEFAMPDRGIVEEVRLEAGKERWVGASLIDDGLEVVVSDKPFRYA
jgi:hypothetical protein